MIKDYIIGFKMSGFIIIFGLLFGYQLTILVEYDMIIGLLYLFFNLGLFVFILVKFTEKILSEEN